MILYPRWPSHRTGGFAGTHSRNIARIHDARTGEVLADLEPPDPRTLITWVSFNHDGSRLGVCEGTEAIRIWDLAVIRAELARLGLDWQGEEKLQIPSSKLQRSSKL